MPYNRAMVLLSVLDQSPIRAGSTPAAAIQESLRLAEAVERLGYHRYWLAEHHSSGALAGSSPEILIGQIAARTTRLRVGSGGVMLSHYSALKVAENFRVLETLFPGRIDLGIGRAPGSDWRTSQALAVGPGALGIEYFPDQIADLLRYVHNDVEPEHPFAGVHAMPVGPTAPEVWLLGSSNGSASYAAYFGLSFAFAHFINPVGGAAVTQAYRTHFRPSRYLAAPRVGLAVFVVCAETEAAARRLARSRELFVVRLHKEGREPFPSVAEAEAYPYTDADRALLAAQRGRTLAGSPEQVRAILDGLVAEYAADELILVTITEDYASRLRSYALVAEAYGLEALES